MHFDFALMLNNYSWSRSESPKMPLNLATTSETMNKTSGSDTNYRKDSSPRVNTSICSHIYIHDEKQPPVIVIMGKVQSLGYFFVKNHPNSSFLIMKLSTMSWSQSEDRLHQNADNCFATFTYTKGKNIHSQLSNIPPHILTLQDLFTDLCVCLCMCV